MIFIDTWAWLALADKRDTHHNKAKETYEKTKKGLLVTSNFILDELITLLFRSVSYDKAVLFVDAMFALAEKGKLQVVEVDKGIFFKAWELKKKYEDKPDISFTDFTSFIIMKEKGIKKVFTGDKHFEKVNMGFTTNLTSSAPNQ